jgi:hypothetical protein
MANAPHLFEDLKLTKMGGVEGTKQGLVIRGIGTFKFKIKDNNGKTHKIKVSNTLFLPDKPIGPPARKSVQGRLLYYL